MRNDDANATNASANGGVTYSGSDATFTPTACFVGLTSFTYHGTGPADDELTHVADVEQPALFADGTMLSSNSGGVLYGHHVTREGYQLGTQGRMGIGEWCTLKCLSLFCLRGQTLLRKVFVARSAVRSIWQKQDDQSTCYRFKLLL